VAEPILQVVANDVEYIKSDVAEVKQDVKDLRAKDIMETQRYIKVLEEKVALYYLTIVNFDTQFAPVRDNFLSKDIFSAEFHPVRNIIYGMVGTILLAVLGGILYIVINKGGP
jgi:hypothetical protein